MTTFASYTGHTTDPSISSLLWLDIKVTTTNPDCTGLSTVYAHSAYSSEYKSRLGSVRRSLASGLWTTTLGTTEVVSARSKWELIGEICRVDGGLMFDRRVCFHYGVRRFYVDPMCRL